MRDRWPAATFVVGVGVFCVAGLAVGHHVPGAAVALALLLVVIAVLLAGAALRHRAMVRRLQRCSVPDELSGIRVRTGHLGDGAFVAGLGRPTIYCDTRLPDTLTEAELRAVLLHERAHQRALDPVRLLLLGLVAPAVRRSAVGRQWLAEALARREIAADRYALANGASRGELASALLKLPPLSRAHVVGFTPAVDLRLQALLGDGVQTRSSVALRSAAAFVAGGWVGAALCSWLLHQWLG